jgi:hypothetical protein
MRPMKSRHLKAVVALAHFIGPHMRINEFQSVGVCEKVGDVGGRRIPFALFDAARDLRSTTPMAANRGGGFRAS